MTADIVIRPAGESETERIAEIMYGDPGPDFTWVMGSRRCARQLGRVLVRLGGEMGWENTIVAEFNGQSAGILQPGLQEEDRVRVEVILAWHTLRIVGPFGLMSVRRRMKVRQRLNFTRPEGTYHVAELHVHKALRGKGIGGVLLSHAEVNARDGGYPAMSLVTATANPARRLYERRGFEVVETKTDAEYEAGTGSEGRVLMVKRMSPSA